MAYKTAKNLIGNRDVYNRYYGDFRGVDFSNDHALVNPLRFAYSVNMYKDYQSEQGKAIETIPGFRVICNEINGEVRAIHSYKYKNESNQEETHILVHSVKTDGTDGEKTTKGILYRVKQIADDTCSCEELNGDFGTNSSVSFLIGNTLILVDGKKITCYDGENLSDIVPYVPTTFINITSQNVDEEYEQKNLLTNQFKNTFVADGKTKEFYLSEACDSIISVKVYGVEVNNGWSLVTKDNNFKLVFDESAESPKKPEDEGYPEDHAGIEIIAEAKNDSSQKIHGCTIGAVFDNRLFLSGNPKYPNTVFYSEIDDNGLPDYTYFGVLNYVPDGAEASAPISAILPVANTLMILKKNAKSDGAVYFHSRVEEDDDIVPVTYPSERGLNGMGCLGACCNFLDDPVFISSLGLEAMGQLSVRYERAIEHRSSLIDAKLTNLDLSKAVLEEWNGYLILLVNGEIFMADSRQRYTDELGVVQYEWYYLNDIGVYDGQQENYYYAPQELVEQLPDTVITFESKVSCAGEAIPNDDNVKRMTFDREIADINEELITIKIPYVEETDENNTTHYYLAEWKGDYIGGTFCPATAIANIDGNLYFGASNGSLCCFNFDKRNKETKEIPAQWFSFNGRTIMSGCATKMDNCDIPHLTKTTVKKSTVIKTKTKTRSAAKIKVRTNKDPYKQIARINTVLFSFEDMNFADFSFVTTDDNLFVIKEKEKKWMEKQYFIYSDEYCAPFALHYISYRYMIAGRLKN